MYTSVKNETILLDDTVINGVPPIDMVCFNTDSPVFEDSERTRCLMRLKRDKGTTLE